MTTHQSALPTASLTILGTAIGYLQNPATTTADPAALAVVLHVASQWPLLQRFPGLDLLRLYALHAPRLLAEATKNQAGIVDFVVRTSGIDQFQVGQLSKEQDTNLMLALRILANLCEKPEGRQVVRAQTSEVGIVSDYTNTNAALGFAHAYARRVCLPLQ
ncbi:PUL domain-containing protein [Jimgerdemannia flammicorona]|uniref:PUL domain-containing protein n=1 Tax=Jimgerdemannia flammicorona TaxID=994334 RepID=A0A433Q3U0_9FUNG|nr:PUL domain-containing protein [Jimgerdemannia flammicorona]